MKIDFSQVKPIKDYVSFIKEDLYSRSDEPSLPITSLPYLNKQIWGLRNRGLTVIGARTSQGKSAFALQIAFDLADAHIPTLFLSLEMTTEDLIERLFCQQYKVDNYVLLAGKIKTDEELQAKWKSFEEMMNKKIHLLVTCGIGKTFDEVSELISIINPTPKVIIVDYIQNISTKAKESREIINEFIRKFRQLAIEKGFAGVLCSQINRGAENNKDNEPLLSQLKDTGFLEESADLCLLLMWENHYNSEIPINKFKIKIAKNRRGKTGIHYVRFYPQYYRFEDIDNENAAEMNKINVTYGD